MLGPGAEVDQFGTEWQALAGLRGLDPRRLLAALAPLRDASGTLIALPAEPVVPTKLQAKTLDVLRRWIATDVLAESSTSTKTGTQSYRGCRFRQ